MPQIIKDILPLKVPMLIWIDPTNMCNFKCVFCPTGDDELLRSVGRPKGMMNMKTYNKIIEAKKKFGDFGGSRIPQYNLLVFWGQEHCFRRSISRGVRIEGRQQLRPRKQLGSTREECCKEKALRCSKL